MFDIGVTRCRLVSFRDVGLQTFKRDKNMGGVLILSFNSQQENSSSRHFYAEAIQFLLQNFRCLFWLEVEKPLH